MKRNALVISALLGIVLAALVVLLFTRDPATERNTKSALIGQIAPVVQGSTLDGSSFTTADLRGRWVFVNFFASWCVPCKVEHSELKAFDEEHSTADDAVLVSVTFDNKVSDARKFFADRGGSWPVIDDPENSIGVSYGVAQVPETFVIAPNGVVVERFAGAVTKKDLDAVIAFYEGDGEQR